MTIEEILLERFTVARRAFVAGTQQNGEITDEFEQTAKRHDLARELEEAKKALEALRNRLLSKSKRAEDPTTWTIEFL
jgi:hypothetical protein